MIINCPYFITAIHLDLFCIIQGWPVSVPWETVPWGWVVYPLGKKDSGPSPLDPLSGGLESWGLTWSSVENLQSHEHRASLTKSQKSLNSRRETIISFHYLFFSPNSYILKSSLSPKTMHLQWIANQNNGADWSTEAIRAIKHFTDIILFLRV